MQQIGTLVLGSHPDCHCFVASELKTNIRFPEKARIFLDLGHQLSLNVFTFMRPSLASLLHSAPRTNFGTRNNVANFSVSVSAASNARMHFRTFSAKL